MFIHNFKYAFKVLFKDKMLIFWTFAFPIILGTFFNMAFSNIEKSEQFSAIDIAVVENEEFKNNRVFSEAFKALSDKNSDERLFNTKYASLKKAKQMLLDDEIEGYVVLEERPRVVVSSSSVSSTVLKYAVEEIMQSESVISSIITDNLKSNGLKSFSSEIYVEALNIMNQSKVNINDTSSKKLSYTMIEFYTLIAMVCLYGGILGMTAVNKNLANMSHNGKRTAVSPTPKRKLILSSVAAGYIVQLIGVAILFAYTVFVLNVDYGTHFLYILLLTLLGSFAGLSMGVAVATLFKAGENLKTGIILSITMVGCFFSGMMGITMKYIIDKNVPIINKINPASMITDGFYSLYYYDTFDRFYFDIISLIIFAFVMLAISMFSLRRQKYDHI